MLRKGNIAEVGDQCKYGAVVFAAMALTEPITVALQEITLI